MTVGLIDQSKCSESGSKRRQLTYKIFVFNMLNIVRVITDEGVLVFKYAPIGDLHESQDPACNVLLDANLDVKLGDFRFAPGLSQKIGGPRAKC
uniref:Uncharacterized protein n=1 Tax=Oryza brachyantha TaxID=4533 RepID=J3MKQ0_ORYBR